MARYSDTVVDTFGYPIAGAVGSVYLTGSNSLAALTSDAGTPLSNPMPPTASDGTFAFNAPAGLYQMVVEADGQEIGPLLIAVGEPTAATSGLNQIAFIQGGAGAVPRSLQNKGREQVSVADFAALGNGTANDTAAIQAANDAAAAAGKDLFFPAGTYMVDPLDGTTNWYGEKGTVIKYRGSGSGFIALVTFDGIDDLVVEGITFHGSVSADPGNWSTGYNSFTGSAGVSFLNCGRVRVRDVRGHHTSWSGIRFVDCDDIAVEGCATWHNRGNFGDGLFIDGCNRVSVSGFFATDYTRIGVVTDSSGGTFCRQIALSRVFATNGHHASSLYGGAEFNAGIWCENSADIAISDCFTADNTHRGINACTGPKPVGFSGTHAVVTIANCQTIGGIWGIYTYSLNDLPIVSKVVNSSAKLARIAYEGDANNGTDSFVWLGCHADYDASVNNGRGFACENLQASGKPSFFVGPGCTVTHSAENLTYLNAQDGSASTADVGTGTSVSGPVSLSIDCDFGGRTAWAKFFGNHAHDFSVEGTDIRIPRGGSNGGAIRIRNAIVRTAILNNANAATAELKDSAVYGDTRISATRVDVNGGSVIIGDSSYLWLLSTATGGAPAVYISGTRFEKNIANDYVLRLGFGTSPFLTIITGVMFYNTGSADTTHAFIGYAASSLRAFGACFADNNVTNITMLDSGGGAETAVTGVTKIAMH